MPFTEDQYHVYVNVQAGPQDRLVELEHHLVRVGVGRWIVELDERDAAVRVVLDQGVVHGCLPGGLFILLFFSGIQYFCYISQCVPVLSFLLSSATSFATTAARYGLA